MALAVQFYGSETLVKAYEQREIPTWAIFQQRQPITAGEGKEALEEFLEMLLSNPTPIYTLRLYKDVSDPDSITEKTPYNGSYNFKLDGDAVGGHSKGEGNSVATRVLRRLEEIESGLLLKKLDVIEERLNAPSSTQIDVIGAVNNLISDPASLVAVINGIKNIFSPAPSRAAGISSTRPYQDPGNTDDPQKELEEKIERMQAAINILEQNDPDLVVHLEKLARLSQENRPLFDIVLKQLDGMIK